MTAAFLPLIISCVFQSTKYSLKAALLHDDSVKLTYLFYAIMSPNENERWYVNIYNKLIL